MDSWMILIFVGVGLLVAGGVAAAYLYEKKRTEHLKKLAEEMGLSFYPKGQPGTISELGGFELFSQGHGKKFSNVLHGETNEVRLGIFDYQYTTGSGKNAHTWKQTVAYLQSPELTLPQFTIRPESIFHKIGSVFGYRDIDFEAHPRFSRHYLLRGRNEEAVRAVLRDEVLGFFEERKGVIAEADGQRLVFYRASKRVKPQEMRSLLEEGLTLYALLKG